jgi:hypothetical protein
MIRKYSLGDVMRQVNDDLAVFEDFWAKPTASFFKGSLYDEDEFDLVPKKKHFERRLKEKEQQLVNVEGIMSHYAEQIKKLKQEIDELKGKLSP